MTSAARRPLGELLRDGDRVGLRFERDLRHPPERVWRALTDSADLRHWMPVDIVGPREAGAEIELPFWPDVVEKYSIDPPSMSGRMVTWDPPRLLEWNWDTDELRFELEPTPTGTRLVFTTWIGHTPGIDLTGAGYHACFDQLAAVLDADDPSTVGTIAEQDQSELEQIYRERFGADA